MPVHDWTQVDAGIFHAFHQQWIISLTNALNAGLLPRSYYALNEQHAAGFGPDVLALESEDEGPDTESDEAGPRFGVSGHGTGPTLLVAEPRLTPTAETDLEFYRRKQSLVAVRHVSGDRTVAIVEIVSPGNKSSASAARSFVEKAAEFLEKGVHLLVIDLFPPGRRDPRGLHAAIWEDVAGQDYTPPPDKPLMLAAYESGLTLRTYARPVAVGDALPDMPLFLKPNAYVEAPMEATYRTAFDAMPLRWRRVLYPAGAVG